MPPRKMAGGGGGGGAGGASKKGKSFWGKGGLEGEVYNNLIDVVCTWGMLGGMALSAVWVERAVPLFCANSNPNDKILTFNCVESVVFGYIYCFIAITAVLLPPYTTNPVQCFFMKVPLPRRIVKFGLQIAAAAAFAVAVNRASAKFADDLYKDVFPRVKLCNVKPFTAYHAKVHAGVDCYPEWPSFGQDGIFSFGVVVNEGLHVFVLNFLLDIILPRVGSKAPILVPFVIPFFVIATIRSPFQNSGPALNLIPATASAVLHGGLEAWRAHFLGCLLGMALAYVADRRLRLSVLDVHSGTPKRNIEDQGAKLKDAPKKAKDFVAKKKANAEFDPNAMLSDLVIKGIPSTSAAKSKKE